MRERWPGTDRETPAGQACLGALENVVVVVCTHVAPDNQLRGGCSGVPYPNQHIFKNPDVNCHLRDSVQYLLHAPSANLLQPIAIYRKQQIPAHPIPLLGPKRTHPAGQLCIGASLTSHQVPLPSSSPLLCHVFICRAVQQCQRVSPRVLPGSDLHVQDDDV